MKSDRALKHFAIAFVIAAGVYILAYAWIENRRQTRGPWQVTFLTTTNGTPQLVINQPKLQIENVVIHFTHTNVTRPENQTIRFENPARPFPYSVPFGRAIFLDTTFLPGTVTLNLFNHEIELLPRVLYVDRNPVEWESGKVITLTEPSPPLPAVSKKKKR